jgi:tetratricopeptide (TPR) repeat protein
MDVKELITKALEKANELFRDGYLAESEEMYRQILRVDPNNVEAMEIGSLVVSKNGKATEAKTWIVDALMVDNTNFRLFNNLGLIHSSINETDRAIWCFNKALELRPDLSYLKTNIAIEHKKTGNYEKAIDVLHKASKDHPDCEHVFFNYGAVVQEMGDPAAAVPLYQRAIKIKYDFPVCHYNLSACWFLLDQYEKAWPEYEWRWKQFDRFAKKRDRFTKPYWSGENLDGKTLVLYIEQGLGDLVMTSRFVPILEEMGAKVIVECPTIAHGLFHCETCVSYTGDMDYHCSLLSVPGVLGCEISGKPYLDRKEGKGIGICWAGSPLHPNDRNRSCSLKHFGIFPGELYGFQKDCRPHVYSDGSVIDFSEANVKFINLADRMVDLSATAKLLGEMDLVVTVDTCVAHLAGAVGVNTFLMLPKVADWRWGLGARTKWYSSMKIFRQSKVGEWGPAFDEALKEYRRQ